MRMKPAGIRAMKRWRKGRFYLQIAGLYAIFGILFVWPYWQRREELRSLQYLNTVSARSEFTQDTPIRLKIPRIGVNVPVVPGTYDKKTWDLSPDSALYATDTVLPNNQSGNTLIYGHHTSGIFLKTDDLHEGDKLYVFTGGNRIFVYTYTSSAVVVPTDTSIFYYQGEPQITLLTCNGFFDTYRRLMFFRFDKVV